MFRFAVSALCAAHVAALPGDANVSAAIKAFKEGNSDLPCLAVECKKPEKKYSQIMHTQPGYQWDDAGGYCGSWSIQRATMAKGAYISQQQVRNHTSPGGGHDEEILATNIEEALTNLKLKFDGFDYENLPTPQIDAYRKWLKKQLVSGHALVLMIMQNGQHYPVYKNLRKIDLYGHIEPFVGILSDHPLSDEEFYDDDVLVHYTDASNFAYYRTMKNLVGSFNYFAACPGEMPGEYGGDYAGYPCFAPDYGFGWAIQGFQDEREGFPLSLAIDKPQWEPDVRSGADAGTFIGTLTAEGLTAGVKYTIHRWDAVESAFDYSKSRKVHTFTASSATEVVTDDTPIASDGTTYYRCVADSSSIAV